MIDVGKIEWREGGKPTHPFLPLLSTNIFPTTTAQNLKFLALKSYLYFYRTHKLKKLIFYLTLLEF